MQIFQGVKESRNNNLLDILAVLSTGVGSASDLDRKMVLGYATIWDNLHYLLENNFVHIVDVQGRAKVFDVTVKGAIASIFSEHNLKPNEKTLALWKNKDWGSGFQGIRPFENVNSIDELKEVIENMYTMSQISLEEINAEFLKVLIVNPVKAANVFRESKISVTDKIEKTGVHTINFDKIPPSTSVIMKTDKKGPLPFIINPDKETQIALKEILLNDPGFERKLGSALLKTIQMMTSNYKRDRKLVSFYYNQDNNTFSIVGEFPHIVITCLKNPEQILQYTINSYTDIINQFYENKPFLEGNKSFFTFRSLKYDPIIKSLEPLSIKEIRVKAKKLLKQL